MSGRGNDHRPFDTGEMRLLPDALPGPRAEHNPLGTSAVDEGRYADARVDSESFRVNLTV